MGTVIRTDWTDHSRRRIPGVLVFILAGLCVLFVRLYQLQVLDGLEYARLSENNCVRIQRVVPARGLILDRTGQVLADNRPSFDVSITPSDAKPVKNILPLLREYLDLDLKTWGPKLLKAEKEAPFTPVVIKTDIDRDRLAIVSAHSLELAGISVQTRSQRSFPLGASFAHLLGYVGEITEKELEKSSTGKIAGDMVGRTGVERMYEDQLAGGKGGRQVEVDARGRVVSVMRTVPAAPGNNLRLTVDAGLQAKAVELLGEETGAVVALDPFSGRVLALASTPSFDPNLFITGMTARQWAGLVNDERRPMHNRAISGAYPPGSTYKVITLMAGLEEGVVNQETLLYCPGFYSFGNRDFWCWKRGGHGPVKAVQALAESCDVYCYRVGEQLGVDRLAYYARSGGLGAITGIGLDGEAKGLVPTMEWKKKRTGRPWTKGETLSVAIGQGYNLATPLQMASLMAAVANGGVLYRPQVAERVERPDHSVAHRFAPEVLGRLPASPKNLAIIRQGLWEVVNTRNGTAWAARSERYGIYGKTGTAQVVGRKDRENFLNQTSSHRRFQDHAWFTAFCTPKGLPGIAVAVIVEHGGHGASTAAPVARDLILEYMRMSDPSADDEKAPSEAAAGVTPTTASAYTPTTAAAYTPVEGRRESP